MGMQSKLRSTTLLLSASVIVFTAFLWVVAGLDDESSVIDAQEAGDDLTVDVVSHSCSGSHEPGFVCPNAKGKGTIEGSGQVLSEKCSLCPRQQDNGGDCPGKYV